MRRVDIHFYNPGFQALPIISTAIWQTTFLTHSVQRLLLAYILSFYTQTHTMIVHTMHIYAYIYIYIYIYICV